MELLVCIALVSILGALGYSFARASWISLKRIEAGVQMRESVILALDGFVREMRMAGYHGGTELDAITAATATEVAMSADLDRDGVLDDPSERIAYRYSAERQSFGRATGGGGAQPIVRDVPADCVGLTYYDADGAVLGSGAPLERAALSRIRRVSLALCSEIEVPTLGTLRSALSVSVTRRNR